MSKSNYFHPFVDLISKFQTADVFMDYLFLQFFLVWSRRKTNKGQLKKIAPFLRVIKKSLKYVQVSFVGFHCNYLHLIILFFIYLHFNTMDMYTIFIVAERFTVLKKGNITLTKVTV